MLDNFQHFFTSDCVAEAGETPAHAVLEGGRGSCLGNVSPPGEQTSFQYGNKMIKGFLLEYIHSMFSVEHSTKDINIYTKY